MGLKAGQTLFLSQSSVNVTHLWVLASDPFDDPPQIVLVSLSTLRDGSDTTVMLKKGDHPFIRRDTVVFYSDIRVKMVRQLEQLLDAGVAKLHADCSDEVLKKIQDGIQKSPFTEPWIKETCKKVI